jgi:hypothetical protein
VYVPTALTVKYSTQTIEHFRFMDYDIGVVKVKLDENNTGLGIYIVFHEFK